ncbi:MAG: hypothetical protein NUW23_13330, partial [Firmicutes bacterium]|nr:hypothetical protein [Bacillota bacterium]
MYSAGADCETRYYTRADDTPASIAELLGVPVGGLIELNPVLASGCPLPEGYMITVPALHGLEGTVVGVSDRRERPDLVLLDLGDGSCSCLPTAACAWTSAPVLSPDGRLIAYQGADGRVRVYDIGAGSDS